MFNRAETPPFATRVQSVSPRFRTISGALRTSRLCRGSLGVPHRLLSWEVSP